MATRPHPHTHVSSVQNTSEYANVSYNALHVYLNLFSVTDGNQQRLVRSKMLRIFKPSNGCLLTTPPPDSHHGSLGGMHTVVKQLEEHKKVNQLLRSSLLQTHKSRKGKGKPGGILLRK